MKSQSKTESKKALLFMLVLSISSIITRFDTTLGFYTLLISFMLYSLNKEKEKNGNEKISLLQYINQSQSVRKVSLALLFTGYILYIIGAIGTYFVNKKF